MDIDCDPCEDFMPPAGILQAEPRHPATTILQ
jgi:hypothetical protein